MSLAKLPKHVGRNRHYNAWEIRIYRRGPAMMTWTPEGPRLVRPRRQFMGAVRPIWARNRQELHDFERQIAYANRHAIGCDWEFEAIDLGPDLRKTMEDLGKRADGTSNNLLPENDPEKQA